MGVVRATALYFGAVFGTGFLFGIVRVLLVAPRVGHRTAELVELPLLLAVIVLAARWTNRLSSRDLGPGGRLGYGLLAAGLVLVADLAVGVFLRGMTPAQVMLDRDPVTGPAYYAAIGVFAVTPRLIGPGRRKG